MDSKPRFNPVITRVKLNPEQAVLACTCWTNSSSALVNGNQRRNTLSTGSACLATRKSHPASWSTGGSSRTTS